MKRKTLSQSLVINSVLGLALLILVISCFLTYFQVQKLFTSSSWVLHTYKVIQIADDILINITDMRGRLSTFIITGDTTRIKNLHEKINKVREDLIQIRSLVKDNPEQLKRVQTLRDTFEKRMQINQEIINNYNAQQLQQSKYVIGLNEERLRLADINAKVIDEITDYEVGLLIQRIRLYEDTLAASNLFIISTMVLSAILFSISIMLLNYHLYLRRIAERKQEKAQHEIQQINKQLVESENRLVLASEAGKIGLWDWNPNTNQAHYSAYFKKMLGYEPDEFPDNLESFNNVLHPSDYESLWSLVAHHLQNPNIILKTEFRLQTKAGPYRWYYSMGRSITDESGAVHRMTGSLIDITDRKVSEQRVSIYYNLIQLFSQVDDWTLALPDILATIIKNLGFDIGIYWVLDKKKNVLVYNATWSNGKGYVDSFINACKVSEFKSGDGLPGSIWQTLEPQWIEDVANAPNYSRLLQAKEAKLHTGLGIPISVEKEFIGVIEFYSFAKLAVDQQLLDFVDSIGKQLSLFIERKWAELELKKISTHNASILATVQDGILTTDEEGNITYANAQAAIMFGYKVKELIDININKLLRPITKPFKAIIDNDTVEFSGYKKNQAFLLTEVTATSIKSSDRKDFLVIIKDITERKRAENLLQRTQEQFRTLVKSIKDYAIIMLNIDGYISTWNAGAESIFGYKADEIIGEHYSKFYEQDIPQRSKTDLQKILAEGRSEIYGWRVRKDGSHFWANIVATPVYDENNEHMGYAAVIRDLTEQRKIEKLKNEFVSVVSHELRTPLTSIRGSLGLVIGGAAGAIPEKATKLLSIANTNCTRLVRLINDILDIEKIEAGKMRFDFKYYELQQLVVDAVSFNKMFAEKYGVKLAIQEIDPTIYVNVDADRFTQVLTNLISNAVKFSPKESTVTISAEKLEKEVRISVVDRGPGIPEGFRKMIFQKFSQADSSSTRKESGTGLGLAISKAIVEHLGGKIAFETVAGKGSTFYFDLPLTSALKTMGEHEGLKKRILICEDDEDQASYLNALLTNAGYETDIAYTAAQTKRFLANNEYYALLLDLILPDMSGIELIKELRQAPTLHGYHVPIIVVSVIATESKTLIDGNAFKIIDWLDKPIDFTKLSKAFDLIKTHIKKDRPIVLHIEDDLDTQQILKNILGARVQIFSVTSIKDAKMLLQQEKFDLVILDLLLPDGNGVELLPQISDSKIPVIIFARGDLDPRYANYVKEVLNKTQTTPEKLLETIDSLLV